MLLHRKIAGIFAVSALVILVSTSSARLGAAEYGFPVVTSYPTDAFAAGFVPLAVVQDSRGVLYVGGDGLKTFDGDRWRSASPNAPSDIFGLDWDSAGRLWTAANSDLGWFESMPDGQWKFHSLRPALQALRDKHGLIERVFSDGNGAIFIAPDSVYRWDGVRLQQWPMVPLRRITGFRIGKNVYFHHRREGLFKMTSAGPQLVIPQSLIGERDEVGVYWIDGQSDQWTIATTAGLLLYKNGQTKPFAPEVSEILRKDAVTTGVRLPDGRAAFGTLSGGIVFMRPDGSLDARFGEKEGLPATYITSLTLDHEGNLWGTGPGQIFRIDYHASSRVFDQRANLRPQIHFAIAKAGQRIVLANNSGVFALDADDQHFSPLNLRTTWRGLFTSPEGAVVCGSRGAWRVTDGEQVQIYRSQYDIATGIASRLHPGEVLLCDRRAPPAIVAVGSDGQKRDLVVNLPSHILSYAEDDEGLLWLASYGNGLLVAKRDPTKSVEAVPASQLFDLPPLEASVQVAGTTNGDVVIFSENKAWIKRHGSKQLSAIENLPAGRAVALSAEWNSSRGWAIFADSNSEAACVTEIVITGKTARAISHSIPNLSVVGMPQSIFSESISPEHTVLWIGGTKSVLREVVTNGEPLKVPQAPILRVMAKSRADDAAKPVTAKLPYSTRSVVFEFAEPEFAKRALLRLQTRIDGIDMDWVPSTLDSQREFTALREGRYTFRVRALAESGEASEPTVFEFEVAPPWWRTAPAFAVAFVLAGASGYLAYWLRLRTLKQRNILLERKVQERTEELAEASAAKTMFVANMSHDIRNPLNGIVGLALALEDTKLDNQQREIVATLRECTTYLSSLVDDVLDFASIEAGKVELRPGPFVPAELLNSVVTTLRAEANERGALITIETDPELPPVLRGDAGRIQQILVNYVSNALKYAGGHIRLAAGVSPSAPGEVEFSVTDEGPGITEVERETLFNKFSRLNSARQSHVPGTGLGLASCRLLADIMSGSVGVESQPGAGARFYLRLPIAVAVEPPPVPPDVALPQTSVLLVEDTDYNALAATAVLRKLGLTCDRACNGEEAVRLFAEKRHNVVLLDRNLPDIDGAEVARRMRALETDGTRAVLLAVTAYCTAEDRTLCVKAGMDAFVGKPLTPDKLRRALIEVGRRMLAAASVDAPADLTRAELDTTLLEYMADGTEAGLATQKERFVAALTESHNHVLEMVRAGDMKQIGDAAHRILGHARMVGATRLSEVSVQLETAARAGSTADLANLLPRLQKEITILTAALRRRPGMQKV